MAKPKSPLLSLGARGTIADAFTFQQRGQEHIVREKPIPKDPYSLNQAYQRWDYRDYAHLWTLLSNAEKQIYRTKASRYHITGFSQWMRENLKALPNLVGRWHLDEKAGSTAFDSSNYQTNGFIVGASPTTGLIDGAQYFTLNDYIIVTAPQLNFTFEDFSVIFRARFTSPLVSQVPICRGLISTDGWVCYIIASGIFQLTTSQVAARQDTYTAVGAVKPNITYTLGFSRSGPSVILYIDGEYSNFVSGAHIDPAPSTRSVKIGIHDNLVSSPVSGWLDHIEVYNRALSPLEHKRFSLRRYPS